jgi:hypothetical protein
VVYDENMTNEKKNMFKRSLIMSLGMCVCMSVTMSLVMTLVNAGFSENFFSIWLRAWGVGFCVALPLSFLVPKLMKRICDKLFNPR